MFNSDVRPGVRSARLEKRRRKIEAIIRVSYPDLWLSTSDVLQAAFCGSKKPPSPQELVDWLKRAEALFQERRKEAELEFQRLWDEEAASEKLNESPSPSVTHQTGDKT